MVLSPSVRELKSHRDLFISLGLFGSLCIHSLLFSPLPSPLPCSFLFSDTPPPPVPFALRAAGQGEHPILSALLSPALPPKSLSSPLASCLSFMSFLAWLCLSLKSTLLFFFTLNPHHSLHPDTLILTLSSRIRTSYVTQILQFERFFRMVPINVSMLKPSSHTCLIQHISSINLSIYMKT